MNVTSCNDYGSLLYGTENMEEDRVANDLIRMYSSFHIL
jgi:hypothetical protein